MPFTTLYTVLKGGCFQRHFQRHPDTSVEDNHLVFMLHPTTYTMTGGKNSQKEGIYLLDLGQGGGDIK